MPVESLIPRASVMTEDTLKTLAWLLLLQQMGFASLSMAQASEGTWTLQPVLSLGKLFPGAPIDRPSTAMFPGADYDAPLGTTSYRYEGTSLGVAVRIHPPAINWLALTLGGGITWLYGSSEEPVAAMPLGGDGVAGDIAPGDFVAFPLSAGLQVFFPADRRHDFALFAGFEAVANFISADIPVGDQIQPGYGLMCGFAVKILEFGLRYQAWADMKNLGIYGGVRLAAFDL